MTPIPFAVRLGAASLAALPVFSGAAFAQAPAGAQKEVQATKVFRYLDRYLKVPIADRSKIRPVFCLKIDGRPASGLHPVLVDGDQRTPLPLNARGCFERTPTLEQLLRKPTVTIDGPPDAKYSNDIDIQSAVKPAQEIDAAEVALSIHQVGAVVRDTVGALAVLMAPTVRASFPGAGSGVAVSASGAQTPLPVDRGAPVYDPAVQRGAVKLRFAHVPAKVDLVPAK